MQTRWVQARSYGQNGPESRPEKAIFDVNCLVKYHLKLEFHQSHKDLEFSSGHFTQST